MVNSSLIQRVVILDRDGVLNIDLPQSLTQLHDLKIIPGAVEGLSLLKTYGFKIMVASNQACVGRGELSVQGLREINAVINMALQGQIDAFYICPHTDMDQCNCRKPLPGLLQQAWQDHHFDPQVTWFVGDAERDVQAAEAFGCRAALVLTGKGQLASRSRPDVPAFDNLLTFARWLCTQETM